MTFFQGNLSFPAIPEGSKAIPHALSQHQLTAGRSSIGICFLKGGHGTCPPNGTRVVTEPKVRSLSTTCRWTRRFQWPTWTGSRRRKSVSSCVGTGGARAVHSHKLRTIATGRQICGERPTGKQNATRSTGLRRASKLWGVHWLLS